MESSSGVVAPTAPRGSGCPYMHPASRIAELLPHRWRLADIYLTVPAAVETGFTGRIQKFGKFAFEWAG